MNKKLQEIIWIVLTIISTIFVSRRVIDSTVLSPVGWFLLLVVWADLAYFVISQITSVIMSIVLEHLAATSEIMQKAIMDAADEIDEENAKETL